MQRLLRRINGSQLTDPTVVESATTKAFQKLATSASILTNALIRHMIVPVVGLVQTQRDPFNANVYAQVVNFETKS